MRIDGYVQHILDQLPEICKTSDLIAAKVFKSRDAAYRARIHREGPEYMKLSSREIIYSKEAVSEWLKRCIHIPEWAKETHDKPCL